MEGDVVRGALVACSPGASARVCLSVCLSLFVYVCVCACVLCLCLCARVKTLERATPSTPVVEAPFLRNNRLCILFLSVFRCVCDPQFRILLNALTRSSYSS